MSETKKPVNREPEKKTKSSSDHRPARPAPSALATKPASTRPVPASTKSAIPSKTAVPAMSRTAPPAKSTQVATKTATAARPVLTKNPAVPATPVAEKPRPAPVAPPPPPPPIELPSNLTVRDLAMHLKVTPIDVIRKLMANGIMANINQPIDFDTASLIASELGFEVIEEKPVVVEAQVTTLTSIPKKREYSEEELAQLVTRPPVVTVMGHVDHGKTTLLDTIRNANVAAGEAGGITQHIGAYQIIRNGKKITFLDTPGHEAFTAMRARGAKVTDLAVIVVAADDGVMPQTREAIDHVRAARVPIMIALNKIDMPGANPERVKQQLAEIGLAVYGGEDEVTVVPISAKQKVGIDELLENITVVTELADLRANPQKPASGFIIESRLDKQQGPMATLLVNEGTLHIGDAFLSGAVWGKIRAMFDDHNQPVKEAGPGFPVVVTGLSDTPEAGETFHVVADEKISRNQAEQVLFARKEAEQKPSRIVNLNDLFKQFQAGKIKELNLIIKADVQGSLEPIVSSLEKLGDEKLKVTVIHRGIGTVTRSDIMLAIASQGIVICFNVGVEAAAQSLTDMEGVDIRHYSIIYKLIEDIDKALKGMLDPVFKDVLAGRAQVLQVFRVKRSAVAGLRVTQGKIARNNSVRVLRGGAEIFKGSLSSLKRFTDDVKEVAEGFECGLALDKFNDFKEGDQLEFYERVKVS